MAWARLYSPELLQLSSYLTVPTSPGPQRQGLFLADKGLVCVCIRRFPLSTYTSPTLFPSRNLAAGSLLVTCCPSRLIC